MYPSQYPQDEPTRITIREVTHAALNVRPFRRSRLPLTLIIVVSITIGFIVTLVAGMLIFSEPEPDVIVIMPYEGTSVVETSSNLSPVFTDEVRFWEDDILHWADEYQLDPNLIATVMQIESCGDPEAGSSAGAQGLFQVMPFHFTADEQNLMKDPNTNAKRGLNYLSEGLKLSNGHVGLALAGYNGGHGVINWGWARMYDETRRYYYWGSGIYQDASSGKQSSAYLIEWLNAGGRNLCNQAAQTQLRLVNKQ